MTAATDAALPASHDIDIPPSEDTKHRTATNVIPFSGLDDVLIHGSAPGVIPKAAPNLSNGIPSVGYPQSRIQLFDRFIDEPRPLRVAVIGGGLAGILAGILLPPKVPNIKLTIYEKNHDLVSNAGLERHTMWANKTTEWNVVRERVSRSPL
jgi:hypothetical protein